MVTAPLAQQSYSLVSADLSLDKISVSLRQFSETLKFAEPLLLSCYNDRGKEVSPQQWPCHTMLSPTHGNPYKGLRGF